MISRIWHGWTTHPNAEKYETLLQEEIFVGIQNRHVLGFKNIQLLRRDVGAEVEFVTIMLFDSNACFKTDPFLQQSRRPEERAALPEHICVCLVASIKK